MKHQTKWLVLVDRGDKLVERIIPAKTGRQAVERCQVGQNRVLCVSRYEGRLELERPDMALFWEQKKRQRMG